MKLSRAAGRRSTFARSSAPCQALSSRPARSSGLRSPRTLPSRCPSLRQTASADVQSDISRASCARVASLTAETSALIQKVVFTDRAPWATLFDAKETFIDATLANHYGLPPPQGTGSAWVPYGTSGRRGLLSHGSFLSVGKTAPDTSPTLRGKMVRNRLMCQFISPPPPEVNADVVDPTGRSKADHYAAHAANGSCASCHKLMDPVGFGLENYDQEGRYRAVEADHPECQIDGQGELDGIGSFHGPAGLADLMLEAGLLNRCAVSQLYRFAAGRPELDDTDNQFVDKLAEAMGTGDFRFDRLILEFVSSEPFGYRRAEQ